MKIRLPRLTHLRINEQIFLLMIILVTIPSIIISIVIYYFSVQSVKQEYVDSSRLILDNLSFNIDQYLQGIEKGALGIYLENDFQRTLQEWNEMPEQVEPFEYLQVENNLRRFIGSINVSIPDVESVQVYANGKVFHSNFFRYAVFDDMDASSTRLVDRALTAKGGHVLESTHISLYGDPSVEVISLARTVNKLGSKQPLGVIVINIRLDAIHNILSLAETANRNFVILDDAAGVVYASDQSLVTDYMNLNDDNNLLAKALVIDDDHYYAPVNNVSSFINYVTSPYSNWTVVQYTDENHMTAQASQLRFIIQIIIILSIVTAIIFLFILYRRVTKPVIELSEKVRLIRDGHFELPASINNGRKDEVGMLYDGFNEMANHLSHNIERTTILKTQQKVAHYSALKSQIHPHFLANALESIQMQAIINDQRDIGEMIGLLGALFRKSIQSGKELVTLEDELAHIRLYVQVQQMRFQDKIHYVEDIDERAFAIGVLHFSLQPFIENAMIHGLEPQSEPGTIFLQATVDGDRLIITIQDNGVGMDQERLKIVREQLCDPSNTLQADSIGMKNVHEQIQYYFGQDYGVSIESELGRGTTVKIELPGDTLPAD